MKDAQDTCVHCTVLQNVYRMYAVVNKLEFSDIADPNRYIIDVITVECAFVAHSVCTQVNDGAWTDNSRKYICDSNH